MNDSHVKGFESEISKLAESFVKIPDLLRWARQKKIIAKSTRRAQYIGKGKYKVKMKPMRVPGTNPYTGRKKKLNVSRYLLTDVDPAKRTLNNIPKYATGKKKVTFERWLMIQRTGMGVGKSLADGKWYGWSHRAISSFNTKKKAEAFHRSVS